MVIPRFLRRVAAVLGFSFVPALAAATPPNFVVILTDDMGWSDLSCYGSEIQTPHLDALARGGMRFGAFYNSAQCCPTRASLISGMYPHEAGVGDMIDGHSLHVRQAANSPQYSDRLDPRARTIAEHLRPAGYQTYMTGKWHLGYHDGQRPLQRGFDRYYGIIAGADSYRKPKTLRDDDTLVAPESLPADFYATDAFTTKAMEYIAAGDAAKPFFLYLAYNAVHSPFEAPADEVARQKGNYDVGWEVIRERRFARQKELGLFPPDTRLPARDPRSQPWTGSEAQLRLAKRMETYAAMLVNMDANIGRLVKFLGQRGQLENTLILFLSDNGAWASGATYGLEWAETGDTPFRLFKLFTHEGGIRTPFIAHWPARIPAGTMNAQRYAHVKDILPTLLEAAGAKPLIREALPLSGRSFLHSLLDPQRVDNETLYFERLGNEAVRDGRWKLVRFYNDLRDYNSQTKRGPGSGVRSGVWELFDLETDPNETRDLAAQQPERVGALAAQWSDWARRVGVIPREEIAARLPAPETPVTPTARK